MPNSGCWRKYKPRRIDAARNRPRVARQCCAAFVEGLTAVLIVNCAVALLEGVASAGCVLLGLETPTAAGPISRVLLPSAERQRHRSTMQRGGDRCGPMLVWPRTRRMFAEAQSLALDSANCCCHDDLPLEDGRLSRPLHPLTRGTAAPATEATCPVPLLKALLAFVETHALVVPRQSREMMLPGRRNEKWRAFARRLGAALASRERAQQVSTRRATVKSDSQFWPQVIDLMTEFSECRLETEPGGKQATMHRGKTMDYLGLSRSSACNKRASAGAAGLSTRRGRGSLGGSCFEASRGQTAACRLAELTFKQRERQDEQG
jgi:hypothetical protein